MPRDRFDVFLTYRHEDAEAAKWLADTLVADGRSVWFDNWEIRPGDLIVATIKSAMARSSVIVALLSAD